MSEAINEALSRRAGEECGGACKHSSVYHVVRFPVKDQEPHLGCSKVDCPCMKFVSSGIENTSVR